MSKTLYLLTIFSSVFLLESCCKCNEDDHETMIRIIDNNGNDLVFGPAKKYDAAAMKLFTIHSGDTTFHRINPYDFEPSRPDSVLYLGYYFGRFDTSYLALSPTDIDTIRIVYGEVEKGCCKGVSLINDVYYNKVKLNYKSGYGIVRK